MSMEIKRDRTEGKKELIKKQVKNEKALRNFYEGMRIYLNLKNGKFRESE